MASLVQRGRTQSGLRCRTTQHAEEHEKKKRKEKEKKRKEKKMTPVFSVNLCVRELLLNVRKSIVFVLNMVIINLGWPSSGCDLQA